MPGAGGLDSLRQIAAGPFVSIVVISGVTRQAAATTLRALELGAVDFILKDTPGAPVSRASLRREIVAKVRLAAAAHPTNRPPAAAAVSPATALPPAGVAAPVAPRTLVRPAAPLDNTGVVMVGASTGGPRAVGELLKQLAADFAMPCVIVQHLPASFTDPFVVQLRRHAQMRVQVAETGTRLEPGLVLVAPG